MNDVDFSLKLIKWYLENKRDLPWRMTKDPYHIWISEIILQQTRVDQGLPYYIRFSKKFPNVASLANANEEEVLKLWQGLGYYSRARNLHYTAKYISKNLDGKFPDKYKDLIKLKGIGEYTAAAISSFAFNEKKLNFRERYFNFIVMTDKDCVLIEKRISNDIWKNLYQFPLFETKSEKFTPPEKFIKKSSLVKKYKTIHKLSHQKLMIVFWHYFSKESIQEDPFKKIKLKNLTTFPVPKIVENYIIQNSSDFRL